MTLYEKVAYLRGKMGISQSELERMSGLSKGTITNWKKRVPNFKSIEKVAKALNCEVSYLTGEEEKEPEYYINEDTRKIAQKVFESKELRLLFDAAKDAESEDIKTTYDMLLALKRKEKGDV